MIKKWSISTR